MFGWKWHPFRYNIALPYQHGLFHFIFCFSREFNVLHLSCSFPIFDLMIFLNLYLTLTHTSLMTREAVINLNLPCISLYIWLSIFSGIQIYFCFWCYSDWNFLLFNRWSSITSISSHNYIYMASSFWFITPARSWSKYTVTCSFFIYKPFA